MPTNEKDKGGNYTVLIWQNMTNYYINFTLTSIHNTFLHGIQVMLRTGELEAMFV